MDMRTHNAVVKFIDSVSNIDEQDYGDFMRKANLYLNNLKAEVSGLLTSEEKKKIDDMQLHLQYFPNWQLEPTRKELLEEALILDQHILNYNPESYRPHPGLYLL